MHRGLRYALFLLLLIDDVLLPAQPSPEVGGSLYDSYPVPPETSRLLFYIQRDKNTNTIAYEAVLDAHGKLAASDPVHVHWWRFAEDGQSEELSSIESRFAYGVKHRGTTEGRASMGFVATNKYGFTVTVLPNGQAIALMRIDGKVARLRTIRVQANDHSWWPKIRYVDIIGSDVTTGAPVTERYIP